MQFTSQRRGRIRYHAAASRTCARVLLLLVSGCATAPATRGPVASVIPSTPRASQTLVVTEPRTRPTSIPALVPEGEPDTVLGVTWEQGVPQFANAPPGSSESSTLAWSPDGRQLATMSDLGVIRIWHVGTGKAIRSWRATPLERASFGDLGPLIAWSPDGSTLAVRDQLWDVATGEAKVAPQAEGVTSFAWSPDGKTLACGNRYKMHLWDTTTQTELTSIEGHTASATSIAWNPSGTQLVTWGQEGKALRIWDTRGPKLLHELEHPETVVSAAWRPDGKFVASGSSDNRVQVWNTSSGRVALQTRGAGSVESITWSPDGKTLAWSGSAQVQLWDVDASRVRVRIEHTPLANAVKFCPDGTSLALATWEGSVRILDTTLGREMGLLAAYSHAVRSVAWSPDGSRLVAADDDGNLHFWDVASGNEIMRFRAHLSWINSAAFSPDGKWVVSGAFEDEQLRIWNAETGEESQNLKGTFRATYTLAWSPDGRKIVSGHNDAARVWDVSTGKELRRLTLDESVQSVAWAPGQNNVVVASHDKTVRLWNTESGAELWRDTLDDWADSVAFSPNGKTIAAGTFVGKVRLFDSATGKTLQAKVKLTEPATAIAWSPDGKSLASLGRYGDGKYRYAFSWWDAETGEMLSAFKGDTFWTRAVAWNPSGQFVASGADDGAVRIWKVEGKAMRPFAVYWASRDSWVSWRSDATPEHRVTRGETGKLLLKRNPDGTLSSIAPSNGEKPQLAVATILLRPARPGQMGELGVRVTNAKGATEAIWVELDAPESPAIRQWAFKLPNIRTRLDPGETLDLPLGFVFHGGLETSVAANFTFALHHAHDHGQGIAVPLVLRYENGNPPL